MNVPKPSRMLLLVTGSIGAVAAAAFLYLELAWGGKLSRALLKPCANLSNIELRDTALDFAEQYLGDVAKLRTTPVEIRRYQDSLGGRATAVRFVEDDEVKFAVTVYPDCDRLQGEIK